MATHHLNPPDSPHITSPHPVLTEIGDQTNRMGTGIRITFQLLLLLFVNLIPGYSFDGGELGQPWRGLCLLTSSCWSSSLVPINHTSSLVLICISTWYNCGHDLITNSSWPATIYLRSLTICQRWSNRRTKEMKKDDWMASRIQMSSSWTSNWRGKVLNLYRQLKEWIQN